MMGLVNDGQDRSLTHRAAGRGGGGVQLSVRIYTRDPARTLVPSAVPGTPSPPLTDAPW